jgi:hypothetical protein
MQTTTDQLRRQDLRMLRAQSLMHAVLQRVEPYLDPQQDRARRDVYEALIELFHNEGVDVITDTARADAGLPPRGPDGWTVEEMVALEKRRMDLLTAPLVATLHGEPVTFIPRSDHQPAQ